MYKVWVNQLIDTANFWFDSYEGTTAQYTTKAIIFKGQDLMITDYTTQPELGPVMQMPNVMCFNALAQTSLTNESVPAFTAYKTVSTPIDAFNAPSLRQTFPQLDKVQMMFRGMSDNISKK
jgi:hypothetical protein